MLTSTLQPQYYKSSFPTLAIVLKTVRNSTTVRNSNSTLTSVSASKDDIGDVADKFMPPCQRVHAMTVTVYMSAGDRTWVAGSQANRLDHSATAHRQRRTTINYA